MSSICVLVGMAAQVFGPAQPIEVQFAQSLNGQMVRVMIDGRQTKTTFAGKLGFRDAHRAWQSLCAEVRRPIQARQHFLVRPASSLKLGGNVALAGNIVAKHFYGAKTAEQCAGLQLAVWEAMEDGGKFADFASGRFRAMATQSALDYGQEFYEAIYEAKEAAFLQAGDDGGQSQISPI